MDEQHFSTAIERAIKALMDLSPDQYKPEILQIHALAVILVNRTAWRDCDDWDGQRWWQDMQEVLERLADLTTLLNSSASFLGTMSQCPEQVQSSH